MKPNDKAIEAALLAAKTVLRNNEITIDSAIFAAVTAAYAAQFQSEDYAEIIDKLRDDYQKTVELCAEAADAFEALLAKRKNLTAAVLLSERQNEILTGDMDRLRTERDALLARLAPVDDKALVEIGIGVIERGNERQWHFAPIEAKKDLYNRMRADLAAVTDERDRMRHALNKIAERHIPDQPASDGKDEADYVRAHYAELRLIAKRAALEGVTEPASPWRDIKSAPKDGTPILCLKQGSGFQPEILHFEDGVFGWLTDDMGFGCHPNRQPTHWMPLPEPPR